MRLGAEQTWDVIGDAYAITRSPSFGRSATSYIRMGPGGRVRWEARCTQLVERVLVKAILGDQFLDPLFDLEFDVVEDFTKLKPTDPVRCERLTMEQHWDLPDLHEAAFDMTVRPEELVTLSLTCRELQRGRDVRLNYVELFMLPVDVPVVPPEPGMRRFDWDL